MNKIAIFSDIHLGVHQNNDFWLGIANKWADWYIKELKDKNITDIIFCGDFFHYRDFRRKLMQSLGWYTLYQKYI